MSAKQYRARADALVGFSDVTADYNLILELEAIAETWRTLADLADQQDALKTALDATRG